MFGQVPTAEHLLAVAVNLQQNIALGGIIDMWQNRVTYDCQKQKQHWPTFGLVSLVTKPDIYEKQMILYVWLTSVDVELVLFNFAALFTLIIQVLNFVFRKYYVICFSILLF